MSTKIIIVGAGAVGLSSAIRLLAAGYRVTLLER
ncbi:MAG: FAD-dependent oxidoreductase, partial [Gallionella sp.]